MDSKERGTETMDEHTASELAYEYVIYVVEDITGTSTDPFHYKVHFYTAMPDIDINH